MNTTLLITLGLLLVAVTSGATYKFFHGRGHKVVGNECVDLTKLRADKNGDPVLEFGSKATLLMFSTKYCGQCPGVRRALAKLEHRHGALLFIEADITDRLDLAAHFNITQTPTVFVLDPQGKIRYRLGGTPKPGVIETELTKLGVK